MRLLSESNEELELELGHAYIIIYLNNLYLYIFCMKIHKHLLYVDLSGFPSYISVS